MRILSLYDRTGNILTPWLYKADITTIDILPAKPGNFAQHITHDILNYQSLQLEHYDIVFGFPPCTHLAASGARWWKDKDKRHPELLQQAIKQVYIILEIAKLVGAHTTVIENPVGRLSTIWRKPDYIFSPHNYVGFFANDNYTKTTCLWTSGNFIMPKPNIKLTYLMSVNNSRIHHMSHKQRQDIGTETPVGFSRAVYHANQHWLSL